MNAMNQLAKSQHRSYGPVSVDPKPEPEDGDVNQFVGCFSLCIIVAIICGVLVYISSL